jgi:outer membrane protein assembly factor BamB
MRTALIVIVWACGLAASSIAQVSSGGADAYWPQWRGPAATGVAPHGDPPTEWSETKNIRWKVAIPGRGHATPIVWGERVYIQTAVPTERVAESQPAERSPAEPHATSGPTESEPARIHKYMLLALDRRTGQTVWEQTLCEAAPHEGGHTDSSQASNSPATDGERIIAYFGSRGVYCLDMDGKLVWKKDLGQMKTRRGFGEGSSPTLYRDTVIITWDNEGPSFIVALDKKTGAERWRTDREEPTSWATPLVLAADGKAQVITSATKRIRSYDFQTGKLLWECTGLTENVIPTPVSASGLVYCTSGFRGSALLAIRYADAQGDITGSPAIAWTYDGKGTPYVPSPLLLGDELYFLQENRAVLSCLDAKNGQPHYAKERLEGLRDVFSSPVGASGRVYVVGRDGKMAVIQAGPEFKILATNALDDSFTASPAIVGKEIYLRGYEHLYCIAPD